MRQRFQTNEIYISIEPNGQLSQRDVLEILTKHFNQVFRHSEFTCSGVEYIENESEHPEELTKMRTHEFRFFMVEILVQIYVESTDEIESEMEDVFGKSSDIREVEVVIP